MQLVSLQMRMSAAINDIFSLKWRICDPKGVFWTIGNDHVLVCYHIIYYQMIKVYRVETMDMGRLCCNNCVSRKCNTGKYCGIYCLG